jgi:hypothetical protein
MQDPSIVPQEEQRRPIGEEQHEKVKHGLSENENFFDRTKA